MHQAVACSVWPGFSRASFWRGQLAKLVVDQRQELLGGLRIAVLDGREDARDVVHRRESPGADGPAATVGTRAPSLGSPRGPTGDGVVSSRLSARDARG